MLLGLPPGEGFLIIFLKEAGGQQTANLSPHLHPTYSLFMGTRWRGFFFVLEECQGQRQITTNMTPSFEGENMASKLLTIAEIAKQLEIPESTVRFYRDRFEPFIPFVGEGRKKRYLPDAAEVLR
ncbi:helix-turn-helix domain-containing protein, partial [Escherichia coli]|nr:helix-turn-helix domain-containing protein [Escherichia coli]